MVSSVRSVGLALRPNSKSTLMGAEVALERTSIRLVRNSPHRADASTISLATSQGSTTDRSPSSASSREAEWARASKVSVVVCRALVRASSGERSELTK